MFFDNPFDFNGDGEMSLWEQDIEYGAFRSVMDDDTLELEEDFDDFEEEDL